MLSKRASSRVVQGERWGGRRYQCSLPGACEGYMLERLCDYFVTVESRGPCAGVTRTVRPLAAGDSADVLAAADAVDRVHASAVGAAPAVDEVAPPVDRVQAVVPAPAVEAIASAAADHAVASAPASQRSRARGRPRAGRCLRCRTGDHGRALHCPGRPRTGGRRRPSRRACPRRCLPKRQSSCASPLRASSPWRPKRLSPISVPSSRSAAAVPSLSFVQAPGRSF